MAGVAAVVFGLDTGALGSLSQGGSAFEQHLLDRLPPPAAAAPVVEMPAEAAHFLPVQAPAMPRLTLPSEGAMPALTGAVEWLNSPPLTAAQRRSVKRPADFLIGMPAVTLQ